VEHLAEFSKESSDKEIKTKENRNEWSKMEQEVLETPRKHLCLPHNVSPSAG